MSFTAKNCSAERSIDRDADVYFFIQGAALSIGRTSVKQAMDFISTI